MAWTVEQVDDAALPSLFRLYRKVMVFPPDDRVETYWRWKFGSGTPGPAHERSFFIVRDGGREVVGALGTLPVIVEVAGRAIPARWAVDLMVDPAARGRGLGKALYAHFRAECPLAMAVGGLLGSPTLRAASAAGFRWSSARYLFKFYNLKALVIRFERLARPIRALSAGASPVIGWLAHRRHRPSPTVCVLQEIDRFTPEVDALWASSARGFAASVRRTHEVLNWKYFDNPFFRYRVVEVRREGRLVGILVSKVAGGDRLVYGTIAEVVTLPEDVETLDVLLSWALARFEEARVDAVKTLASASGLARALKRFGFIPFGPSCALQVASNLDVAVDLADCSNWFLIKGDSDLDMTPDFTRVGGGRD